jgi:uracil-DNA glycosylase
MKLEDYIQDLEWQRELAGAFSNPRWNIISEKVEQAYAQPFSFPPRPQIFAAFNATPFSKVRVVIIGQDPYHGDGEANGLAFSVNEGIKIPPSLRNIFKELKDDLGIDRTRTHLQDWAHQGIFLLNTTLTVEQDKPLSHKALGWDWFTDYVIQRLALKTTPIVFVLWGKHAQSKKQYIGSNRHHIIESAHPSPLGAYRGFFGSKPFSQINQFLGEEIRW